MNATLPYVAPWQSGFEKYATQILRANTRTGFQLDWIVAANQWWRFVYVYAACITSAFAGTRAILLRYTTPAQGVVMDIYAIFTQPVSVTYYYLFNTTGVAYSNNGGSGQQQSVVAIPDVLWGPGTTVSMIVSNGQFQDTINNVGSVAGVEIYTEDRPGVFVPEVAQPTPLIP